MKFFPRLTALCLLAGLAAGCSSFDRKWRAAGQPGASAQSSRWDGRWTSARHKGSTGSPEGGRLRCVLQWKDETHADAYFHANWKVFTADYRVPLLAQPSRDLASRKNAAIALSGSHQLPEIFGGTYRYDARIFGDDFRAHYSSRYDAGTFAMTRQLTNPTAFH